MDPRSISRLVQASTEAQGLPERLEDPTVALRIGRIISRQLSEEQVKNRQPRKSVARRRA